MASYTSYITASTASIQAKNMASTTDGFQNDILLISEEAAFLFYRQVCISTAAAVGSTYSTSGGRRCPLGTQRRPHVVGWLLLRAAGPRGRGGAKRLAAMVKKIVVLH